MSDEYYFNSIDEAITEWPFKIWLTMGKPKLWVKVYEEGGTIKVWRDYGYGKIKLQTLEGESEGEEEVSVGNITVAWDKGSISVHKGEEK